MRYKHYTKRDARKARDLRFLELRKLGLTVEEAAAAVGLSPRQALARLKQAREGFLSLERACP